MSGIDWLYWLYAQRDWLTLCAVLILFGAVGIVFWIAGYVLYCARQRWMLHGHALGYLDGRREERLVAYSDPDGSAHYPMIIERAPDGTTRRLDR